MTLFLKINLKRSFYKKKTKPQPKTNYNYYNSYQNEHY